MLFRSGWTPQSSAWIPRSTLQSFFRRSIKLSARKAIGVMACLSIVLAESSNCFAQRRNSFAIAHRFQAGQSAAISCNEGLSSTFENGLLMKSNISSLAGHWLPYIVISLAASGMVIAATNVPVKAAISAGTGAQNVSFGGFKYKPKPERVFPIRTIDGNTNMIAGKWAWEDIQQNGKRGMSQISEPAIRWQPLSGKVVRVNGNEVEIEWTPLCPLSSSSCSHQCFCCATSKLSS